MPGQGLEGALEILEATNQMYFVRAANADAKSASANLTLGASPAVALSGNWNANAPSSLVYVLTDNNGVQYPSALVTLPSTTTAFNTPQKVLFNSFNPNIFEDQPVFAAVSGSTLFLASKYAGENARLRVSSTAGDGLRFIPLNASGNLSAVADPNQNQDITASGFTISSINLRGYSLYPGTAYNLSALRDGSTQGISLEVVNNSVKDTLVINSEGAQAEQFRGSLVTSSADFFEFLLQEDELNAQSEYVYVNAVSSDDTDYAGFPDNISDRLEVGVGVNNDTGTKNATPRFVKLIEGTYNFAGGDSGYGNALTGDQPDSSDETALIGNAAQKTGIHALDDDSLNISIALVPGVTDDNVQNELITVAESSKNFLALISPPYAIGEVQDAINWLNGKGDRTAAVNSSYAAAYWPWVQVQAYGH
jgi:hypothetical protein